MLHLAVGQGSGAIAEHESLTGADPPHGGGVKTLVTAQHGERAGLG
jgi:hypothetical protein